MGWKEYLEDYENKEKERLNRINKEARSQDISSFESLFPTHRFPNFHQPVARLFGSPYRIKENDSIWSRSLLSGTTLCPLFPTPLSSFEEENGFRIREIPEIIDFIKRTGKVAFYLREYPTAYKHLDFLEPVMTELRPICLSSIPLSAFFPADEVKKYIVEFWTLAGLALIPMIKRDMLAYMGTLSSVQHTIREAEWCYVCLKGLGYHRISEEIENTIVSDPEAARRTLAVAARLITNPLLSFLPESSIIDHERYLMDLEVTRNLMLDTPSPQFPCEIGTFLSKMLVHSPPSFDACKELYYHYEEHDVYKTAMALNEGIIASEPDTIEKSVSDLSETMNSIWENRNLRRKALGIRLGIHVSLGVVGPVAALLSGGIEGLLAGLGVAVGEAFLTTRSEEISEGLARKLCLNREVTVYDFRRKYKLDS